MNALIPLLLALAAQEGDPAEAARVDVPIPEKVQAAAVDEAPPAVSIRTESNGDRVEEYRQNGVLYMVKVTPERGPAYYLMDTDGNGRLDRDPDLDIVAPVYWTIYAWD